jgi:hypothetical protein
MVAAGGAGEVGREGLPPPPPQAGRVATRRRRRRCRRTTPDSALVGRVEDEERGASREETDHAGCSGVGRIGLARVECDGDPTSLGLGESSSAWIGAFASR